MEVVFQNSLGQAIREWPSQTNQSTGAPIILAINFELKDIGDIIRLLEVPEGVL